MTTPALASNQVEYLALNNSPDAQASTDMVELMELTDFELQPGLQAQSEVSGLAQGVFVRIRWSGGSPNVFQIMLEGGEEAGETEMQEAKTRIEYAASAYFTWWMLSYDGIGRQRTIKTYADLHDLENKLRRRIAASMARCYGMDWWTVSAEPDLLAIQRRCGNRKSDEENDLEHDFERMHDIFYADFSDLPKIIDEATCWADVFRNVFIRKGAYYKLNELRTLRNRVMHNRYLTAENFAESGCIYFHTRALLVCSRGCFLALDGTTHVYQPYVISTGTMTSSAVAGTSDS